jgi:flagellum-specific ATP synthase
VYPAIDVEASISRALPAVTTPAQRERILRFRQLSSAYARNRDLITVGAYAQGSDPRVDAAIKHRPEMLKFLQQEATQRVSLAQSIAELERLFRDDGAVTGR